MKQWITDRLPTAEDGDYEGCVYMTHYGKVIRSSYNFVRQGTPWMPITLPKPYVKPKRFVVETYKTYVNDDDFSDEDADYITVYAVIDTQHSAWVSRMLPTKEAAEEIAAIYEKVTQ